MGNTIKITGRSQDRPNTFSIANLSFKCQRFSVIIHNFIVLHKFFLFILYNIPYCKTQKVVLSYSHKEKVLNDFSDAKKAHRWKAEIAEKPTDAKESIL